MDGFFEKYGRVIIIAVAICFVLLYLTPMRNVVGSSINGFAGNFANKVGESIGTVKLPDGSANIAKEKSSKLITGRNFNNKIPSEATTIIFTDEKAPEGISTIDLTVVQDGDVVGWLDGTTWKISTQNNSKKILFNEYSDDMFDDCKNLQEIHFNNVDTSQVTNMWSMFRECSSLTNLDLSSFDTSKVTIMNQMFKDCEKLKNLDLSGFDTSNVTSMSEMFSSCSNLTNLDLSSFDTSHVTDMSHMFYYCSSLTNLDVNHFNTSKVTTMYMMFLNCSSLTSLDISEFDTSKVTDMTWMLDDCYKLTKVKASQATYNNMNSLAEKANKTLKDYIHLNPNKIEIVNK